MADEKKESQLEQLQSDLQVVKDFIPRVKDFIAKNKKRLIIIGSFLIVFGAVATYEMIHLSSEPWFCNWFCHEMTPEVDAWKKSFHASLDPPVKCVECHYGPGVWGVVIAKYNAQYQLLHHATGSYANHPLSKMAKHNKELEEEGLPPIELAPQNIHQKGEKVYYMKAHGYALQVINDNCKRCHQNYADIVRSKGRSVRMDHKGHLGRGFECTDCHIEIVHGTDPEGLNLPTMLTCFRCHNDKTAPRENATNEDGEVLEGQGCVLCHEGQKHMWAGIDAKGVEETPSEMLNNEDCDDCPTCIDCHEADAKYAPPKNDDICVDCHDDDYRGIVKEWQTEIDRKTSRLTRRLNTLGKRIREYAGSGDEYKTAKASAAQAFYDDALFNTNMVTHDGSRGVHNYEYAVAIVDAAIEQLKQAENELEKK